MTRLYAWLFAGQAELDRQIEKFRRLRQAYAAVNGAAVTPASLPDPGIRAKMPRSRCDGAA